MHPTSSPPDLDTMTTASPVSSSNGAAAMQSKLKVTNASDLMSVLTPKTLSKFTTMDRAPPSLVPPTAAHVQASSNHQMHHERLEPPGPTLAAAHQHAQQAPPAATPPRATYDRKVSKSSTRSNSTSSGHSAVSLESDVSSANSGSGGGGGGGNKRASWTKAIFRRSKSQTSLNQLEQLHITTQQHHECFNNGAAVPSCLKSHEARLRRIYDCTQKNVNGLILRTQHTETDILQMVARHCNHTGCRRKAINAAMRNLERRISMLNKYRDAIYHFVVNQHQEVLQSSPAKKAEAEALYDLCVRNSKACMDLANQGAHASGTTLVALSDRLHRLQKQLHEVSQTDISSLGGVSQQQQQQYQHLPGASSPGGSAAVHSPTRSMSALSLHSHGDAGETEDYVMGIVPTVPQPIQFKLARPAKPAKNAMTSHGGSHGDKDGNAKEGNNKHQSSGSGGTDSAPGSPKLMSPGRALCARSSKLQKLSQDQL